MLLLILVEAAPPTASSVPVLGRWAQRLLLQINVQQTQLRTKNSEAQKGQLCATRHKEIDVGEMSFTQIPQVRVRSPGAG